MLLGYGQYKFRYTPLKIHDRIRGYLIQNNVFVFAREWNSVPVTRKGSPKKPVIPADPAFSHTNVLQNLL